MKVNRTVGLGVMIMSVMFFSVSSMRADTGEKLSIPAWRGQAPGTDYLGPDVLWRPRECLVFHMLDEKGGGFNITFTIRDMNTYLQGARPAFFMVIGPKDEIIARHFMEDDGIVSGNERYRDGIYDPCKLGSLDIYYA